MEVFVSVATGLNPEQEAFVAEVERRLTGLGFVPRTIGRNMFTTEAPLRAIAKLMDGCAGAVVIALERYNFEKGIERRGALQEKILTAQALPTPWNQIEAAMAYSRGLPLLVLVDENLRREGLLEKANEWFVQEVSLEPSCLNSPALIGLFDDWKKRVLARKPTVLNVADPSKMSVVALVGALGLPQVWALLGAVAVLLAGAFGVGAYVEKNNPPKVAAPAVGKAS